jgi:phosphatidylethanolamine-binding protein
VNPLQGCMHAMSKLTGRTGYYCLSAGDEVVAYTGAQPPVGIHRYVLVLFQQKTRVRAEAPGERANFNTRAFAATHDLGLPAAVVYFNAHKEPASRRR